MEKPEEGQYKEEWSNVRLWDEFSWQIFKPADPIDTYQNIEVYDDNWFLNMFCDYMRRNRVNAVIANSQNR